MVVFGPDGLAAARRAPAAIRITRIVAPIEIQTAEPFRVVATVRNVGGETIARPRATIIPPSGFAIAGNRTKSLGLALAPDAEQVVGWTITPLRTQEGRRFFRLRVRGNDGAVADELRFFNTVLFNGLPALAPPPLLGAHGLGGVADSLTPALEFAQDSVPRLPDVLSAATAQFGSASSNARELVEAATLLASRSGVRKVNVIAHSKGGLDAREAIWRAPARSGGLAMLGTPNGGSEYAELYCAGEIPAGQLLLVGGRLGPCRGPEDGVFSLQRSFVQNDFNRRIRDYRHVRYLAAAGVCSEGSACNFLNRLLNCRDGGDGVVCLESAWSKTEGLTSRPTHIRVGPDNTTHEGLRTRRCSVDRVLAPLYQRFYAGAEVLAPPLCPSPLPPPSAAATAAEVEPGPGERQRLGAMALTPATPLVVPLDPEGGDATSAIVIAPPEVPLGFSLGGPGQLSVETEELFGDRLHSLRVSGLSGQGSTLSIAATVPAEILVATLAESAVVATADIRTPGGAGTPSTVALTLSGLGPDPGASYRATATVHGRAGGQEITFSAPPLGCAAGPTCVLTGSAVLPPGEFLPVSISLAGSRSRQVSAGVTIPDGSATIGQASASRLAPRRCRRGREP